MREGNITNVTVLKQTSLSNEYFSHVVCESATLTGSVPRGVDLRHATMWKWARVAVAQDPRQVTPTGLAEVATVAAVPHVAG